MKTRVTTILFAVAFFASPTWSQTSFEFGDIPDPSTPFPLTVGPGDRLTLGEAAMLSASFEIGDPNDATSSALFIAGGTLGQDDRYQHVSRDYCSRAQSEYHRLSLLYRIWRIAETSTTSL